MFPILQNIQFDSVFLQLIGMFLSIINLILLDVFLISIDHRNTLLDSFLYISQIIRQFIIIIVFIAVGNSILYRISSKQIKQDRL